MRIAPTHYRKRNRKLMRFRKIMYNPEYRTELHASHFIEGLTHLHAEADEYRNGAGDVTWHLDWAMGIPLRWGVRGHHIGERWSLMHHLIPNGDGMTGGESNTMGYPDVGDSWGDRRSQWPNLYNYHSNGIFAKRKNSLGNGPGFYTGDGGWLNWCNNTAGGEHYME